MPLKRTLPRLFQEAQFIGGESRRFGKPADSAHDELSWRNFPRMKSHPASKPSATGPVTGHSGEVSTPEMSTPPRPLKTGADRHGFPNREAIVHKALERFLSVENPISRPRQEVLKPHRLS